MANYVSMDNLRFIIHEMLQIEQLCKLSRYQDYEKDNFDMLLDSTKDYADKVLFPTFKEMDEQAAHYC